MKKYNPNKIERKWHTIWHTASQSQTNAEQTQKNAETSVDKPKYYVLDMFPYPSGDGLHMGHTESYTASDIIYRYKRLQGFDVLHPQGFDSFGLPAENYAVKTGIHPKETTRKNTANYIQQMKMLGLGHDLNHLIYTSDPSYYKWTQWLFGKFFENGLVEQKTDKINWCPSCNTGIANEQVEQGKCERCKTEIQQKEVPGWFFKITDFAEDLIRDLDKVDWPEHTKKNQKNWIGKSVGAKISFKIKKSSQIQAEQTQNDAEEDKNDKLLYKELTYKIRGAMFDVKKSVGTGHKESVYHKALEIEFKKRGLVFESEKRIDVEHCGEKIGTYQPDFVIEDKVLIELKAVPKIGRQQLNQTWTYLKGSKYKLALLANYSPAELEIKRMVYDTARESGGSASSAFVLQKSATSIEVFTTRPDTLFGATYLVVAPEHELIQNSKLEIQNYKEVVEYIKKAKNKTEMERMEAKEKTGVKLEGLVAVNPANGEKIPIFVADYVLGGYGTGAIMAVPAHDERDYEFATYYNKSLNDAERAQKNAEKIKIKQVIAPRFDGEGDNVIKKDKPMTERKIVDVIIKHWKEDKYFCLDWSKKSHNKWYSFVVGGVEKGETLEEAALREAQEESGYKNMKVVKQVGGEIHSYFYAAHKGVNRAPVKRNCIMIELLGDEWEEPAEEHTKNHDGVWIEKDKVLEFINLPELKLYWHIFLGKENQIFTGEGELINSGEFDGMSSKEAKKKITEFVGGEMTVNYRLRDWSISRQRYWGCPIPIVYSPEGEAKFVGEENLPWLLPEDVDFVPDGTAPLAKSKELKERAEKLFGKGWMPEVDTMDTFVDSSWYFLRYPDPENDKEFCAPEKLKRWLPVDLYIGGAEHTYMHLLYARFFVKAMHKMKLLDFDEPFMKLRHQGMVLDKNGVKMSKSKGNVINPNDMVEKFGADATRMYMMFAGPLEEDVMFKEEGVKGVYRFLEKVFSLFKRAQTNTEFTRTNADEKQIKETIEFKDCENENCKDVPKNFLSLWHKTIKGVTEDIENLRFNTAISKLMIFINECSKHKTLPMSAMKGFLILLSPFAPHIAEELFTVLRSQIEAELTRNDAEKNINEESLSNTDSIFNQSWPKYNPKMIEDKSVEMVIQINGKVRDKMQVPADISEEKAKEKALQSEKIKQYTENKEIKKIIFVKGRLINLVI